MSDPESSAASPASPGTPKAQPLSRLLEHAAAAVAAVRAGRSLTQALEALPDAVRPGAQALAFHAMRHLGRSEVLREALVPRRPPPAVEALLLCAFSLLDESGDGAQPQPPSSPPSPSYAAHTVVDQAVRCAKRMAPAQAGLVNAVLRRALRDAAVLASAVQGEPRARWNHPAWWIERLRQDWPEQADALLQVNNGRAPMTLRVNARRTDGAAYLARLRAAGLDADRIGSHTLVLHEPQPVECLPGFADGEVSVQDAAAQLAAPLLLQHLPVGTRPRLLDACAAPGGKTAHLLERADADVVALDVDAGRLQRVDATLQRLGLQAGAMQAADAGCPSEWWDGQAFDGILLDAPCTASGIVRRHPDVRWLRRPADVAQLAAAQARLLDALWPLLKPGGVLVYCTCSVFKAEGSEQVDVFLQRHPDARSLDAPGHVLTVADNPATVALLGRGDGSPLPAARLQGCFDGFFYAALRKQPG